MILEAVSQHCWILLLAIGLDALVGDPEWLWRRVPHPVVLFGRIVRLLDAGLNREAMQPTSRRALGVAAEAVLLLVAVGLGWLLARVFAALPLGWVLEAAVVAVFLALRSLHQHVKAVADAFDSGLGQARAAVRHIVGRDPDSLDTHGVCRAAIESCAENFSDGVVAPAFWYVLLGLPGLLAYKAANTADSMIGHRTTRHEAFGWAAARTDDLLNLIPARLSGLLLAAASGAATWRSIGAMRRDASRHRSPNAGWPEAAMAGALGLALAGPRRYVGHMVEDAWMGSGGRPEATPQDLRAALRLLTRAGVLLWASTLLAAVLISAARDPEQRVQIDMRLAMAGERIQGSVDTVLEPQAAGRTRA